MPKLTFDDVIEAVNNEQAIDRNDVPARVLKRKIWISSNGSPGCMSDTTGVNTRKADAIESCLIISDDDGMGGQCAPRGMKTWLRKAGDRAFDVNGYRYRVERATVADLF